MALNQRERRLALATGSVLSIALLQFGYNAVQSAFDEEPVQPVQPDQPDESSGRDHETEIAAVADIHGTHAPDAIHPISGFPT